MKAHPNTHSPSAKAGRLHGSPYFRNLFKSLVDNLTKQTLQRPHPTKSTDFTKSREVTKETATINTREERRGFPTLLHYLKYPVFNNKKECKENRKIQPIIEKAVNRKCG